MGAERDLSCFPSKERLHDFAQSRPCCCRNLIPVSSLEHLVVGLNLLRLLVYNRISEFHTDLELLDPEVLLNFMALCR